MYHNDRDVENGMVTGAIGRRERRTCEVTVTRWVMQYITVEVEVEDDGYCDKDEAIEQAKRYHDWETDEDTADDYEVE